MTSLCYAITGANGQIGSFLVDFLRKRRNTVYELVRAEDKAKEKKYYQHFDLAKPLEMPSLKHIDILIHTAHFFDTTDKNYKKTNVLGTQKLFQQARADGVKYNIFISSISAHAAAFSLYGKVKYELEQLLIEEKSQGVIIRPGLIFHTPLQGITAAIEHYVMKYPIVPLIGGGTQPIYPCLLTELAQLIETVSIKQPKINKPIVAASENSVTFKELIKFLAKQNGKRILFLTIPFYAVYSLLRIMEFLNLPVGLRSDSLLGLQFVNKEMDFSETQNLGFSFNQILNLREIQRWDIC